MLLSLRRELDGRAVTREVHHHRVPLGLVMLEKGWITTDQLRKALDEQRKSGTGRLGDKLIEQRATDEATVARALGLQWSCPVFSLESHNPEGLAAILPRLFVESFGALPLRVTAGNLLYIGFEASIDASLCLAVERVTGLRVESGILPSSLFRPAHARMLRVRFPTVHLAEAVSESAAAHLLARAIERFQPAASRLVRVHDCVWLRMWARRDNSTLPHIGTISDVLCSIGAL